MGRVIEIVFPRRGGTFRARLLEELAPKTCQAIWEVLPIKTCVYHTRRSGKEIQVVFPEAPTPPGPENQTIYANPGDIFYVYFPPIPRVDLPHLGLFYGGYSKPSVPFGAVPQNLFAQVLEEQHEDFAELCERLWREGYDHIIIQPATDT
jgi:hypothetical protein